MTPQTCPAGAPAPDAWGTYSGLKGPAGCALCVGLAPWDAFFLPLVSSRPHTCWLSWRPSPHLPASTVSYLIPLLRHLKARIFSFFFFFFQNIYLFIYLFGCSGLRHMGSFVAVPSLFAALRLSYPVACRTLAPPPGVASASPCFGRQILFFFFFLS